MGFRLLSLLSLMALSGAAMGATPEPNIVGAWTCGPYEMQASNLVISAVDRSVFSPDGSFTEHGFATYTREQVRIRTETRHTGNWTLQGDLIEVRFTSSQFLSSDHPALKVADGQATLDAAMRRKNWARKRILKFDAESMLTIPVDETDKQAEVQVSCARG